MRPRGHDVAVLFSRRSRDAYAADATIRGETYTFTDAWGRPRTWLKGEYAYLAPSAAGGLLARCNLKHDVVEEADLDDERVAGYRAVLVPNAAQLAGETIERLERWLRGADRRLIVTGKTNLPPATARAHRLRAGGGHRLYRLALAAWLSLRERGLGEPLRERVCGPPGAAGGARAGQPRAGRAGRAHGRSDQRHDGDGDHPRAGPRAHRADGLRRQPGAGADRRHAPGAPERGSGTPLGEPDALGRHAPLLPAAPAPRGRARALVADASALVRRL